MLGPTASGKSALAEAIAARIGAEILSVDSMQVFRGMDIGTAKPDTATRERFSYHMVDVTDPSDEFTAAEFQAQGTQLLEGADERGTPIVIAGGSGLHFRSLVDPLRFPPTDRNLREELEAATPEALRAELVKADSGAEGIIDLANPRRVLRAVEVLRLTGLSPTARSATTEAADVRAYRPIRSFTAVGIDPGAGLPRRIEERFDAMLDAGLADEIAELAPAMGRTARQAVGYRELLSVIEESVALPTARDRAIRATNALAKRQRTYFRRDPRIRWIPWHHETEEMLADVLKHHEEGSA